MEMEGNVREKSLRISKSNTKHYGLWIYFELSDVEVLECREPIMFRNHLVNEVEELKWVKNWMF